MVLNCSNGTEVAQQKDTSCGKPQPATDNGVRDRTSNWLAVTPTLYRSALAERHLHGANAGHKSQM